MKHIIIIMKKLVYAYKKSYKPHYYEKPNTDNFPLSIWFFL